MYYYSDTTGHSQERAAHGVTAMSQKLSAWITCLFVLWYRYVSVFCVSGVERNIMVTCSNVKCVETGKVCIVKY